MLDKNKLIELERLAGVFYTVPQIAIVLQVEQLDLDREIFRNGNTPEYTAYHKGKLQSEADVRQAIFKAAKDGSGPAQALAMKLIEDNKIDML